MSGRSLGIADITPGQSQSPVWHYEIEDGVLELFYPSIADMIGAVERLTPFTEQMGSNGDDVFARHTAAAHHPQFFEVDDQPSFLVR